MNKELLLNLHQTAEYKLLLKEIRDRRPLIPRYDPKANNIEEMKAASIAQGTFDMILSIMSPWSLPQVTWGSDEV